MQLLPGKTPLEKLATFVATGFGLGVLAPFASGTWGSIPGVALAYATTLLPWWWQVAACLALSAAAVPLCGIAEKVFDRKDDGRIVADEYLLLPIGFLDRGDLWATLTGGHAKEALLFLAIGFAIARAVDILKPSPARQIQAVKGGLGVVLDDLVASLYTWILLWGLARYLPALAG